MHIDNTIVVFTSARVFEQPISLSDSCAFGPQGPISATDYVSCNMLLLALYKLIPSHLLDKTISNLLTGQSSLTGERSKPAILGLRGMPQRFLEKPGEWKDHPHQLVLPSYTGEEPR
ncbi:hypothetical protein HWV62_596 [Athelia sp. TMB]|nr:hypothetical protein HWV62_596 [Athelia sp. TMB]